MVQLTLSRLLPVAALLFVTLLASGQEDSRPTVSPFSLNLRFGLTRSQVGVNYSSFTKWYGYDQGFRVGMEYERPFPNRTRQWSASAEVAYQAFTTSKEGTYPSWFECQTIDLNIGLRRYFDLAETIRLSLFLGTGLTLNQTSREHRSYTVVHYVATEVSEYEWRPSIIGGTGISFQRFTLEFRYSYRSGQAINIFSRPSSLYQMEVNLVYAIVKK